MEVTLKLAYNCPIKDHAQVAEGDLKYKLGTPDGDHPVDGIV